MKKILRLPFCAIVALLSTVSIQADDSKKTPTKTVKTIKTSALRGVQASAGFDVTLKQGAISGAVISVDSRLQPYLIAEVKKGVLILGFEPIDNSEKSRRELQHKLQNSKTIRKAVVTVTSLKQLQARSGADIVGTGEFSAPNVCEITVRSRGNIKGINLTARELRIQARSSGDVHINAKADYIVVNASSSSDVTINGITNKLVVKTSSSSEANLVGLKANDVSADASSSSDIKCFATEKIRAHASSSADIRYAIESLDVDETTSSSSSGSCKRVRF